MKFNSTLSNIKDIIGKDWHLLQINPKLFQDGPIIAYKRNRDLNNSIQEKKK